MRGAHSTERRHRQSNTLVSILSVIEFFFVKETTNVTNDPERMHHYFISDLHLDPSQPEIRDAFVHFLQNQLADAASLYILGDFFEVWLGDDDDDAFNLEIIANLKKLTIPVYIMHGNRDFLLGDKFCQATNCVLLADPTVVELFGTQFLLMHGDSLCTRDQTYMTTRKAFRDPLFQKDFLSKPLAERKVFAQSIRDQSKEHMQGSVEEIMDVTPEEVIAEMEQHGVNQLIHGHTHRPAHHSVKLSHGQGSRYVMGDWTELGWYLVVSDSASGAQVALKSFRIA